MSSSHLSACKRIYCSNNRLSQFEQFGFLCRAVDFFKKVSRNCVLSYRNSSSRTSPVLFIMLFILFRSDALAHLCYFRSARHCQFASSVKSISRPRRFKRKPSTNIGCSVQQQSGYILNLLKLLKLFFHSF